MIRNDFYGDILANPGIGRAETRPWGNLYLTESVLPLLDIQAEGALPQLHSGPKTDGLPPVDLTIATFGEVNPDFDRPAASLAQVVGKYDERHKYSKGHIYALLNQEATATPTDRIGQISDQLSFGLEDMLSRMPALRVEYGIRASYVRNIHIGALAGVGFIVAENAIRGGQNHVIDYIGGVVIFVAGMIATLKESGDRLEALNKNVPVYEQSAKKLTKLMLSDLAEAPARWQSPSN